MSHRVGSPPLSQHFGLGVSFRDQEALSEAASFFHSALARTLKTARTVGRMEGLTHIDASKVRSIEETDPLMDEHSRHIRTTWMLSAAEPLNIPHLRASIRYFPEKEAQELALTAKKRNVFAHHSWENSFYVQRIESLAHSTVIELFLRR